MKIANKPALRWSWFSIYFFTLVLGVALYLRFYHFTEQWDIFGDAGRDQIVALTAARRHYLPLSGSFSSSGPFVFGPGYYWILTLTLLILPFFPTAIQLVFRLLRTLPIFFYWQIGKLTGGVRLAIILTLLALTSPGGVLRDVSLTHHAVAGVLSTALVWLFVVYIDVLKKDAGVNKSNPQRLLLAFGLGAIFGLGFNIHFFTLNLWPIFLIYLLLHHLAIWRVWKEIVLIIVGFLLPNIPYFWWDATVNNWANLRNFLDYLLIVQERRYIPNRWLTYLLTFWPNLWGSLVGGSSFFGYLLPILALMSFVWQQVKRQLSITTRALLAIFLIKLILLRFYRGEVYFGYLLTFTPFILYFSALAIGQLISFNRFVGTVFFGLILLVNFHSATKMLRQKIAGSSVSPVREVVATLKKLYPDSTFTPYVYGVPPEDNSYGVVIMLSQEGLISEEGMPIGLCVQNCSPIYPEIVSQKIRQVIAIADLRGVDIAAANVEAAQENPPRPPWKKFTPEAIYTEVAEWWKEKPLTSPFSLPKYILGRLGFGP